MDRSASLAPARWFWKQAAAQIQSSPADTLASLLHHVIRESGCHCLYAQISSTFLAICLRWNGSIEAKCSAPVFSIIQHLQIHAQSMTLPGAEPLDTNLS